MLFLILSMLATFAAGTIFYILFITIYSITYAFLEGVDKVTTKDNNKRE